MPGRQRILVVSAAADGAELERVRQGLGRDRLVLAAPTVEAKQVVRTLGLEPRVEVLLAPVRFPDADRGHRLDTMVRRHALEDRFRDVVVVTDAATATLLLRTLAPDQLADRGGVSVVALPRGDRLVSLRRVVAAALALGVLASLAEPLTPIFTLPAVVAAIGLALLLLPAWRYLGRELLLDAVIGFGVVLLVITGSQRFPGGA